MDEIWKEIPGYPTYYVSNQGHIKHVLKDGRELFLKLRRNIGVQIRGCSGKPALNISIGKLMYSVFKGIDRSKLEGLYAIGNTLDELMLFNKNDFFEEIRNRKKNKRRNEKDVEKLQMEIYKDIQTIFSVWETGDSSVLFDRIENYKEETINYIYRKFSIGRYDAEKIWDIVRFILSDNILSKKNAHCSFSGFLKNTARNIVLKERDRKKKFRSFDNRQLHKPYKNI